MAVKKGILDNFLKPTSHYSDNQKNLRSIFIDKDEDDLKPDSENSFEPLVVRKTPTGTQQEHNRNTIGTQNSHEKPLNTEPQEKIGTQLEHNKNTSRTQKEHIRNTIGTQKRLQEHNWNTIGTQLEHVKEHKIEHNRNTIGTQLEHNKNTKGLSYLSGIQKQLIVFFYLSCKKNRSHTTEEFSLLNIANTLKIPLGSIKNSLRRLEEKGFIKGIQFKKGRGGWTKFELPDTVYRELLESEKEHNWNTTGTQLEHIKDTYRNTYRNTIPSSSSSILNNKETTTTELSDEWNFDITPYSRFGFTISQVKQLAALGIISATDVEQSLIEFNYDLENNALPSIKTNKINFLMGLLRSGHLYVSEGFKNEQEATIAEMARRAETKRKNLLEAKFMAWESSLGDNERKEIEKKLPTQLMVLHRAHGIGQSDVRKWLFDYFIQNLKG